MSVLDSVVHAFVAMTTALSGIAWNLVGKMSFWIPSVLAADARKAEGASIAALRIPSLPSLIGRVTCVY